MRPILSLDAIVRWLVTAAFICTLMQYFTPLPIGGIAPVIALAIAGGCALLRARRGHILHHLFSHGTLLMLFLFFFEVVSCYSGYAYSMQYGIVLLCLVLSARLILLQIGLAQIVRSYIHSALLCLVVALASGKKELAEYQVGQANRFTAGSYAHPNLLGFTMVSYVPLFAGCFLESTTRVRRYVFLAAAVMASLVMFFAGSRGSLLSAIIPPLFFLLRFTLLRPSLGRWRVRASALAAGLSALTASVYLLTRRHRLVSLSSFVVKALALDNPYRGVNSGLSGRTAIWSYTIHHIGGLQWLFGAGYRMAYVVDNGYITVLFDNGIVGVLVVVGSLLRVLYWLWTGTRERGAGGWWRYRLVLLAIVLGYLINSITARYLLSYGNQFSLLIIFLMLSSREEVLGGPPPASRERAVARAATGMAPAHASA